MDKAAFVSIGGAVGGYIRVGVEPIQEINNRHTTGVVIL